ncbi:tyrosine-type recombinase/integrase [Nocardia seriolae]|uniref:Tyr recombinase domain-containing protein n=2 Tax=Nocardia seriolae TaxID=37332 RepID=A0A0B8N181_9NOCA|nr:site-specific integrase [Nocardia seriolae]MTJ65220.1 tyrosine-type recombinase/integrase [Nocardia seriolae]MTJ70726.1 tyrosine-type recombinase/integrase [Nocardia seriolae]MTJ86861.1 tyrosine-type recombinase/integrase [Nocardia seriolae]MTK30856.1 tyrosine-type recombinase/integrase [Nocardia seriolae]MTK43175.1 tyrosine-type recombinase/integrase [Nocardia seriolae]
MNEYMITLMERGHTAKATQHWIILSGMFDTARRHGAIDHNPMDATLRPARRLDEPHTLPHNVFDGFLRQVDTWCHDKAIPGRPARHGGTTRDARIYWTIQLLLDTGVRPGELLGLRIHDVELDVPTPGIWIRGKLENQGKGRGWRWQPGLKTGSKGIRRLALSSRGIRAIHELLAYGIPSEDNLLIPSRTGKGWSPNNFGRLWRTVRTDEFAAVTPTQIRHRVATDIRDINGIEAAAAQLGDSPLVVARYYAARNQHVDNRTALEPTSG